MCAAIENPASCEVRSVIRFLLVENHKPIEIHIAKQKVKKSDSKQAPGKIKFQGFDFP
jgi:hypothetical protein